MAVVVLTVPLFTRFLASLRLIRLARLLRLFLVAIIVSRALQAERRMTSTQAVRAVGLFTLFTIVIAGVAQATLDTGDFKSYWNGLWWAVVTITGVGYGDHLPDDGYRANHRDHADVRWDRLSRCPDSTIASRFVKQDIGTDEVKAALARIEQELAELKQQLEALTVSMAVDSAPARESAPPYEAAIPVRLACCRSSDRDPATAKLRRLVFQRCTRTART